MLCLGGIRNLNYVKVRLLQSLLLIVTKYQMKTGDKMAAPGVASPERLEAIEHPVTLDSSAHGKSLAPELVQMQYWICD